MAGARCGFAGFRLVLACIAGLGGCAPTTSMEPAPVEGIEVFTVSGRYPARRSGILIAQNAALQEGRAMCETQGKRFRPIGSIAGEDPDTGEAVYAVRFRCLAARGSMPAAPQPTRGPDAGGQM